MPRHKLTPLSVCLVSAFCGSAAFADIPVIDNRHKCQEAQSAGNDAQIKETDKKRYAKSASVTCSLYRKGNGPSSTTNLNPEIVGLVKRIADEEGVDETIFLSLVYQESRFNPCAKSPVGAIGLTQLMPGTASDLGVNPHDIEQNLRGGARYLKQMLRQFGSLDEALAAYNSGAGNVIEYGGIPPFKETRGYVYNITQKWMPVFGGGAAGNIPLNYGGGNAFSSARDATLSGFAQSQATADSQANVKSWYEQFGGQYAGTVQDSFDQNSGVRNANLAMLNQAILTMTSFAELINALNTLSLSDSSGSDGSLDPVPIPPATDPTTPVTGTCDPATHTVWNEDMRACVLQLDTGAPALALPAAN